MEKCEWFDKRIEKLSKHLWIPEKLSDFGEHKFNYEFNKNKLINFKSYSNPNSENSKININHKIKLNIKTKDQIDKQFEKRKEKIDLIEDEQKRNIAIKSLETKKQKKIDNIGKIIKTKSYKIYFTDKQKEIIFRWFRECDTVYNETIRRFNAKNGEFSFDYKKLKLQIFNKLYGKSKKSCPYDILTDEVRIACSNIKSCLTNFKNGNIKHFEIKEKNKYKLRSILIPKPRITTKGIYSTILGKQDFGNINTAIITSDCRLTYNFIRKEFFLLTPIYEKIKTIDDRKEATSIDPGEKIPFTFYSPSECGKIAEDVRKPILKIQQKIRKHQSALNRNKNKKDKKVRNKTKLKNKIRNNYRKIKNIVKELHNQSAIFLCKNYKRIIIPKFETQKMLKNDKKGMKARIKENNQKIINEANNKEEMKVNLKSYKRKTRLNGRVKFVLNCLSHYKFRQHLLMKCEEYGCQLFVGTEEYTSKCCGRCGYLSDIYKNREKICPYCGLKINRDINGARDIMLKHYPELKMTVKNG